ncbi:MAG TPA: YdcF family protein [Phycisphaerae bacterium]|nr:YdcF family protein [Phycisphaerae bacterium]
MVLIILFALFIITPVSAWVYGWFDCHDELVRAKYIICLGGNANRIIESARLLQEGWAEKLIVTNHGRFADDMRDVAVEWGADPSKILIDRASHTTCDHPAAVRAAAGLDPATDVCIIVTNYTHMQRAKACFERAGYRHLILREPRWERRFRAPEESTWKARFLIFPQMLYEAAAWTEYRLRGVV